MVLFVVVVISNNNESFVTAAKNAHIFLLEVFSSLRIISTSTLYQKLLKSLISRLKQTNLEKGTSFHKIQITTIFSIYTS